MFQLEHLILERLPWRLHLVRISPAAPATSPCTRETLGLCGEVLGEAVPEAEGRMDILAVCVAQGQADVRAWRLRAGLVPAAGGAWASPSVPGSTKGRNLHALYFLPVGRQVAQHI